MATKIKVGNKTYESLKEMVLSKEFQESPEGQYVLGKREKMPSSEERTFHPIMVNHQNQHSSSVSSEPSFNESPLVT